MDNRVAGCQPPAGATPLLRFGLPSPPGVVGMVVAPGSASGKHPFYVVCKCGLGCCVCGGRRVGVGAWGRGPLVMLHVRALFVGGGGCVWVKCPCGWSGPHPGCWVLGWCPPPPLPRPTQQRAGPQSAAALRGTPGRRWGTRNDARWHTLHGHPVFTQGPEGPVLQLLLQKLAVLHCGADGQPHVLRLVLRLHERPPANAWGHRTHSRRGPAPRGTTGPFGTSPPQNVLVPVHRRDHCWRVCVAAGGTAGHGPSGVRRERGGAGLRGGVVRRAVGDGEGSAPPPPPQWC